MIFDPFGDFQNRGYLRNVAGEKDLEIVRRLEHTSFTTGLEAALDNLMGRESLSYDEVLETHRILFDAIYPWAGQDRLQNAPDIAVSKGPILFAHPQSIRKAIEYALEHGQNPATMAAKPGEIMGYLAYGHPFLDGNGRTIMVVHSVLAARAGIIIDWSATDKNAYLAALTTELDEPGRGHLDSHLRPFARKMLPAENLADAIAQAPGLDGNDMLNQVLGKTSDPALKARYEQQQLKRKRD